MTSGNTKSLSASDDLITLDKAPTLLEGIKATLYRQCQLLQQMVDTVPVLVYLYDMIEQHLVYANHSLDDLLGYPVDCFMSSPADMLLALVHPDDQPRLIAHHSRYALARDGDVVETEFRVRHANGTWRWLLNRSTVFARTADGAPKQLLGTAQDITERKREAERIDASLQREITILESMGEGFFALDENWHFTYVNREAARLLQKSREELIGANIWESFPLAVGSIFYQEYHRARAEQVSVSFEAFFEPFDTWFQVRAYPSPTGLSVYFRSITMDKRMQEQMIFHANVLAQVNDAVIAVDIAHRITYWNKGAEQLYGFTSDEVLGKYVHEVQQHRWLSLEDKQVWSAALASTESWRGKNLHRTKYGKDITVESNVSVLYDSQKLTAIGLLSVIRDITAQTRAQELLQWRALHDTLTHLPNRMLFVDRLGTALERGLQQGSSRCAVLFLDLDNFKVVNDSMGHMVGDRMLIAVARRLEECLPDDAVVARFGGDEFLILLEAIDDVDEVIAIADQIHEALDSPILLNQSSTIVTSTSIGIALSDPRYEEPEDMLRDANVAMNLVKRQQGGHTLVFDTAMYEQAQQRLWVETALRQAIEQDEFVPFYQPIVSLQTGKVVGFEVLIRWLHPQRGFIQPDSFIPVAEETGMIGAIGQKMLRMACQQAYSWLHYQQLDGEFAINVNISGKEFLSPGLVNQVAQALHESGLDAHRLKLEITETVAMDRAEVTVNTLQQLHQLGIQIALDDFGMGYSSLRYLSRFPIQTLKIDRSLVKTMGQKPESETIVRTIVTMAHSMGLNVVAEGIETDAHQAYLAAMQCDYGQGFLFSRPVDANQAGSLLRRDLAADALDASTPEC